MMPAEKQDPWSGGVGDPGAGGLEGARRATGGAPAASPSQGTTLRAVNPEVEPKAQRRRFTAEYKLRILKEVESCSNSGEIGALLRREGLYSSHLTKWRKQRDAGALKGLEPKKRGPKPDPALPLARQVKELERDNERLRRKLRQAETIIEVQKKVSEILGISLAQVEFDEEET
jgi:transposase